MTFVQKKLMLSLIVFGLVVIGSLIFYKYDQSEPSKEHTVVKKREATEKTLPTTKKIQLQPSQETVQTQPQRESQPKPETVKLEPPKQSLVICIDPGHQRKANLASEPIGPGATTQKPKVTGGTTGVSTGKPEYVLNLEASLILGKILRGKGYEVVYTRTTHDVNLSNIERAEMANQHQAALFIRIHADGSTNARTDGFSILTPSSKNPYTKATYQDSFEAGQAILDEVKEAGNVKVNGISYRDDMSGLNWAKVPAVLIEMGFMTNPQEDRNLSNQDYLTKLMTEISAGVDAFTKN